MQRRGRSSWAHIWTGLKLMIAVGAVGLVFDLSLQQLGLRTAVVLTLAVMTALLFHHVLRLEAEQAFRKGLTDQKFLISMRRLFSAKLLIVAFLLLCSLFTTALWLSVALAILLVLVTATLATIIWRQSKDLTSPPAT